MGTAIDMVVCKKCGSPITKGDGIGTGFAVDEHGNCICYKCCADIDIQWMKEHDKTTLYLVDTEDGYYVMNWPGSFKIRADRVKHGKHNIAGARIDAWFNFEGEVWHGTQYGKYSDICHCQKTKQKVL